MPWHLISLFLAALMVLPHGQALALEPTLLDDSDYSWPSVQGGTDGNPVVDFNGQLTGEQSMRERFTDVPGWIVSEDFDNDGVYEAVVQFTEGTLRILSLSNGHLRTVASARNMAPDVPQLVVASLGGEPTGGLVGTDDRGVLVSIDYATGRTRRLASGFSPLSHPVAADLDDDGEMEIAAVNDEGNMTVIKGRTQTRSDNAAQLLPDNRIAAADLDGDGTLEIVAFSTPADDFSPGRLGDDLEARGVSIFNWNGRTLDLEAELTLPDGQIFEMLTPVIAKSSSEDNAVLMLSVTEENQGTRIRSYSYSNGRIREKRNGPVSDPDQWIHVLGSSILGDSDRVFLLTALVSEDEESDLELYRLDLAQKRITLRSAVTTYIQGSRLLEVSLIGDFDKDGGVDLLAPGDGRTSLAIHSLERNRLKGKEIFNTSRKISTNLCPGDFNGDGVSDIILGLDDGTLVVIFGK